MVSELCALPISSEAPFPSSQGARGGGRCGSPVLSRIRRQKSCTVEGHGREAEPIPPAGTFWGPMTVFVAPRAETAPLWRNAIRSRAAGPRSMRVRSTPLPVPSFTGALSWDVRRHSVMAWERENSGVPSHGRHTTAMSVGRLLVKLGFELGGIAEGLKGLHEACHL